MKSSLTHFLLVGLLTLSTIASYSFWYLKVSEKSNEVIELEDKTAEAASELERISSARAILSDIAEDEVRVQKYFLSDSDVVAFINDLQSRGLPEKATVRVSSITKGGTAEKPAFLLTVTIQGSFDAVLTTIGSIEYAPYNISVPTFSISKSEKGEWSSEMSLVVGAASTPS